MALSIIKALKDVAQAFKVLPKYTPIHMQNSITTSTNLVSTGVSQEIPANSYVCLTATAAWGHSKPSAVQIEWDRTDSDLYCFSEGYTEFQAASATISFYTNRKCKVNVKAKYVSAAVNPITLAGYIVTFGGGYGVTWLGGGLHAKFEKMLARYRQFCTDISWKSNRKSEGWSTVDSVGSYVNDYSFWSECGRQIYRFSSEIFTYSCSVWSMHLQHKLSGFIQYFNKQHFNNSVFDGIQEQSCDKIYNSSCLDCNRQGVTPRGCCHA